MELSPGFLDQHGPDFTHLLGVCESRELGFRVAWDVVINDDLLALSIDIEVDGVDASSIDFLSVKHTLNASRTLS